MKTFSLTLLQWIRSQIIGILIAIIAILIVTAYAAPYSSKYSTGEWSMSCQNNANGGRCYKMNTTNGAIYTSDGLSYPGEDNKLFSKPFNQ